MDAQPLVVLIGPADSYRLGPYRRAAETLGVDVVVLTDRPGGILGTTRVIDLDAPEQAALAGVAPSAVIGVDGSALRAAALLAAAHGITRANTVGAMAAADDKGAQRRAVSRTPVRQPAFRTIPYGTDAAGPSAEVGFPAVIKPCRLTAGQGVLRVEDPLDARAAAALVRTMVPEGSALLVERFVGGGEVAVEGLLDDGRLHVLAVFDKPDPPQGPTFPETVLVTPSRLAADLQHRLHGDTAAVCAALGLRHGPVHAEFRIAPDGTPSFLEIAARTIGGRCASMLHFRDGATLEELVLRQALGLAFDARRVGGAAGVHMLPVPRSGRVVAIDGVEEARRLDGIAEVAIDVAIGEPVEALPFGGRYAGFVFARAATTEAVAATLAKASVRVEVQP